MGRDLRDLFKEDQGNGKGPSLRQGHETRFLDLLERELPQKQQPRSRRMLWAVAASVAVLLGTALFLFLGKNNPIQGDTVVDTPTQVVEKQLQGISLGDLSPDLQKIESYYVTTINMELAGIEVSEDNRELVDGFMTRLATLDQEYQRLNAELNEVGPNEQTISALIRNLELRLQLLYKLRTKLNELKSENETVDSYSI